MFAYLLFNHSDEDSIFFFFCLLQIPASWACGPLWKPSLWAFLISILFFKEVSRKDCDIISWSRSRQGCIYPQVASTGSWWYKLRDGNGLGRPSPSLISGRSTWSPPVSFPLVCSGYQTPIKRSLVEKPLESYTPCAILYCSSKETFIKHLNGIFFLNLEKIYFQLFPQALFSSYAYPSFSLFSHPNWKLGDDFWIVLGFLWIFSAAKITELAHDHFGRIPSSHYNYLLQAGR